MLLGAISDTHIPVRAQKLPKQVFEAFDGVDLILHAGDLVSEEVILQLRAIAPVEAVAGNCDPLYLSERLPRTRLLQLAGFSIGLTHGHIGSPELSTPKRALALFESSDLVVFGHSHRPYNNIVQGVHLFNPGSPTDRRGAPQHSVGLIKLGQEIICQHIFFSGIDNAY